MSEVRDVRITPLDHTGRPLHFERAVFHGTAQQVAEDIEVMTHRFSELQMAIALTAAGHRFFVRLVRDMEAAERRARRMRGYHPTSKPVPSKRNVHRYGR